MMRSGEIPEAEWAKLMALQQRHSQLEALLPSGMNDFADLDAGQLDAKLADIEMISTEMLAVGAAERVILEELLERQ